MPPVNIQNVNRLPRTTFATLLLLCLGTVLAHATLVFGELTIPGGDNPDAAVGFTLQLHMMDPVRTPIEDATVAAEFRLLTDQELEALEAEPGSADEGPAEGVQAAELELPDGDWHVFALEETGPGGNYAAAIQLPEAGVYQLIMRDTTYPQEDAVADLTMRFDGETEFDTALFIFPPTDIGAASLGTWLLWLVALPVVAGVIVTVAVMARKPDGSKDAGDKH